MLMLPLLLLGCWNTDERLAVEEEEVRLEMAEHWDEATQARDAIIQGDLTAATKAAAKLHARLPLEGLPEELREREKPLQTAMGEAGGAADLTTAALAMGRAAQACGECHAANGITPQLDDPPLPPEGDGTASEMARHQWAAQKLWLGLVRPSQSDFDEACKALEHASLLSDDARLQSQAASELEKGVHQLAASVADGSSSRGEIYGQLLTTCATCHLVLRDGKGQSP